VIYNIELDLKFTGFVCRAWERRKRWMAMAVIRVMVARIVMVI